MFKKRNSSKAYGSTINFHRWYSTKKQHKLNHLTPKKVGNTRNSSQ